MKVPFKSANILIPKNADMTKWSVVACDQYTSEPEYWKTVENIVGDAPSTLKITLPEIYLEKDGVEKRIENINHEDNNEQKYIPKPMPNINDPQNRATIETLRHEIEKLSPPSAATKRRCMMAQVCKYF